MVIGEEVLCCQFKGKIIQQLLFSCIFSQGVDRLDHSAETYSYQPIIWRMWLVDKLGGVYCFGKGDYFFSVNNQKDMEEEGRSEEKSRNAVNSKL
jgi:hypothetical protein